MDNSALFKLGYGLYVLTARDGDRDNGCIINTVMQVTSIPPLVGVITVNKKNHTHDMIMRSRKFNISVLTTETPFKVFQHFGFQSGATVDKFAGCADIPRSKNGVIHLPKHINAYLSFEVTGVLDFASHTMFKADITAGEVTGKTESLTYAYYQQHIKPRPQTSALNGHRCNICGYIHQDAVLPTDFICPVCKHGVIDFARI